MISGAGGIGKTGTDTVTLTGVNTYSSGTDIVQGTLIGSATSFGTGAIDDEACVAHGSAQGSDATQRPCMYLYCLPAEKAPLLLHLLDQEGTSAASIYPGYKGVVDALRESHGAVNYRDDPTESFGPSTVPGE